MKAILASLIAVSVLCALTTSIGKTQISSPKPSHRNKLSHVEWVGKCLAEIQGIRSGMKRADVEKVMQTEGRRFSPAWGHYVHKECRYFKVDFEFTYSRSKDGQALWSPDDRIVKISRPYLDAMVIH
jgi:hypothetical protein